MSAQPRPNESLPIVGAGEPAICAACRGELVWEPHVAGLRCPYCAQVSAAESLPPGDARPLPQGGAGAPVADPAVPGAFSDRGQARCERCAARVILEPPVLSGPCAFCGAPTVVEPQAPGGALIPSAVAPLTVPREQAEMAVRRWLSSRFFCPGRVARLARVKAITGMYLPFWCFDFAVYARWKAWVDRSERGGLPDRLEGEIDRNYTDVLAYAGAGLPPEDWRRVLSIAPRDLVGYHPAFVRGIPAEAASISIEEGVARGRDELAKLVEDDARGELSGSDVTYRFRIEQLEIRSAAYRQVLLPLWVVVYSYGFRTYRCLVGGHTGLAYGEAPTSWLNVAFAGLSGIGLTGLFGWLGLSWLIP